MERLQAAETSAANSVMTASRVNLLIQGRFEDSGSIVIAEKIGTMVRYLRRSALEKKLTNELWSFEIDMKPDLHEASGVVEISGHDFYDFENEAERGVDWTADTDIIHAQLQKNRETADTKRRFVKVHGRSWKEEMHETFQGSCCRLNAQDCPAFWINIMEVP